MWRHASTSYRSEELARGGGGAVPLLWVLVLLFVPSLAGAQSVDRLVPDDAGLGSWASPEVKPAAATSWLYAIDDGRRDGSGTLFRLGVSASGGVVDVKVVGETGVRTVFDIAFAGDRLFGIGPGTSFGTSEDVLIEIDPKTGATTGIGRIDPSGTFNALEGETASTLIAATTTGEVWRIDFVALTATRLGVFGSGFSSSGDLALVAGGTLYGVLQGSPSDVLATVNRATGRASRIGSIGFRQVYGLEFNPVTGALLGVVDAVRSPKLVSVNRSTGAATVIGAIPVPEGITGLAAGPAPSSGCPSGFFSDPSYRDFCFRVRIGDSDSAVPGTREDGCLPDTVCVSGALPGRSELFLRILGPRPNGFLWPTIVRFTPSRVVVDVHQRSRDRTKRYVLRPVPPGVDDLSGLQDRTGFRP